MTPGIIDAHSHLGVYRLAGTAPSHEDGNEAVSPNTAEVWAEHSVWPQDPEIPAGARRRHHVADDPAGVGQSVRRPLGHAQECAGGDDAVQ